MTTWAVIATGESLKPAPEVVVEKVRYLPCVAVNNAFLFAPWARVLVAGDAPWWREHPEARSLACDLWCSSEIKGVKWMPKGARGLGTWSNSGLRALDLTIHVYGAKRVLLLGFDMVGKHCHPDHPAPLKNPNAARFEEFKKQFRKYLSQIPKDVEVLNCSPISALQCFPKVSIDEALCFPA